MPSAALHSQYWAATAAPASGASQVVSYPLWQTTITLGSGFGALQAVYDTLTTRTTTRTTTQDVTHGNR
jgi:hypothetical protein